MRYANITQAVIGGVSREALTDHYTIAEIDEAFARARINRPWKRARPSHVTDHAATETYNAWLAEETQRAEEAKPQRQLWSAIEARWPGRAQQEVAGLVPGRRFRADIAFEAERLVVEVDGIRAHSFHDKGRSPYGGALSAVEADRDKDLCLREAGYRIVRYSGRQVVHDLERTLNDIARQITPQALGEEDMKHHLARKYPQLGHYPSDMLARREALGATLHRMRESANLTIRDLGDISGIGRTSISNHETGRSVPSFHQLCRYANVYELSLSELLNGI